MNDDVRFGPSDNNPPKRDISELFKDGDMPIRQQNALKNTFPEVVEKWYKMLNISDKPNGQKIAELMESESSKLLKEEFNQLDELNDYLRMLADMDKVGIRRKILVLESYINNLKKGINK